MQVPTHAVKDGKIVLNIAERAVASLEMSNDVIRFSARFGGVSHAVSVPVAAVLAIYARETGQGMALPEDALAARRPTKPTPRMEVEADRRGQSPTPLERGARTRTLPATATIRTPAHADAAPRRTPAHREVTGAASVRLQQRGSRARMRTSVQLRHRRRHRPAEGDQPVAAQHQPADMAILAIVRIVEAERALQPEPAIVLAAHAQADGVHAVVQPLHAGDAQASRPSASARSAAARPAFQNANAIADTIIRMIRVGIRPMWWRRMRRRKPHVCASGGGEGAA